MSFFKNTRALHQNGHLSLPIKYPPPIVFTPRIVFRFISFDHMFEHTSFLKSPMSFFKNTRALHQNGHLFLPIKSPPPIVFTPRIVFRFISFDHMFEHTSFLKSPMSFFKNTRALHQNGHLFLPIKYPPPPPPLLPLSPHTHTQQHCHLAQW